MWGELDFVFEFEFDFDFQFQNEMCIFVVVLRVGTGEGLSENKYQFFNQKLSELTCLVENLRLKKKRKKKRTRNSQRAIKFMHTEGRSVNAYSLFIKHASFLIRWI